MDKQDFAYIGCKLLAIYIAIKAIYSAGTFASSLAALKSRSSEMSFEMQGMIYYVLVPFIIYSLIALFLWFRASSIVKMIIPKNINESSNEPISLYQVQAIAFATIGIFILILTLPELGGILYKIHLIKEMDNYARIELNTKVLIFEYTAKIVLGLLLIFSSKGLSGLLIKLREAGIK